MNILIGGNPKIAVVVENDIGGNRPVDFLVYQRKVKNVVFQFHIAHVFREADKIAGPVHGRDDVIPDFGVVGIRDRQAIVAVAGDDVVVGPDVVCPDGEVAVALVGRVGIQEIVPDLDGVHPGFADQDAGREGITDIIAVQQDVGPGGDVDAVFSGAEDGVVPDDDAAFQVVGVVMLVAGDGVLQVGCGRVFYPAVFDQHVLQQVVGGAVEQDAVDAVVVYINPLEPDIPPALGEAHGVGTTMGDINIFDDDPAGAFIAVEPQHIVAAVIEVQAFDDDVIVPQN